jgi:hypothetical protein
MLKNSWLFPVIQSVHLAGIALLVGTITLADLRTLGFKTQTAARAWTHAGLVVIAVTGPVLFIADVPRYVSNPAFLFKMTALVLAVLFHFTIHRRPTRIHAIVSLILWTSVVLGGRAIADFDV